MVSLSTTMFAETGSQLRSIHVCLCANYVAVGEIFRHVDGDFHKDEHRNPIPRSGEKDSSSMPNSPSTTRGMPMILLLVFTLLITHEVKASAHENARQG